MGFGIGDVCRSAADKFAPDMLLNREQAATIEQALIIAVKMVENLK